MKAWPKNGDTVEIKDLVEPLVAAFAHCYYSTLKQDAGPFKYMGLDFGIPETAAGPSAQALLENPAEPLRAILEAGVKLGIEQGRRNQRDRKLFTTFNEEAKPAVPAGWPEDDRKTVYFERLTAPLADALHHFYKLKRVRHSVDVDYQGYDTGESLHACCPSPDHMLKAESLRYDQQEQGRPAYVMIIGIAVQLGMEQGERLLKQDPDYLAKLKQQDANVEEGKRKWEAMPVEDKRRALEALKKLLDQDGP